MNEPVPDERENINIVCSVFIRKYIVYQNSNEKNIQIELQKIIHISCMSDTCQEEI